MLRGITMAAALLLINACLVDVIDQSECTCPDDAPLFESRLNACVTGGEFAQIHQPGDCTDVFDPMCGCDGVTYSNRCNASESGMQVAYAGRCWE